MDDLVAELHEGCELNQFTLGLDDVATLRDDHESSGQLRNAEVLDHLPLSEQAEMVLFHTCRSSTHRVGGRRAIDIAFRGCMCLAFAIEDREQLESLVGRA